MKTLQNLTKRGLATLLALALCVGTMSLPAMAAELDSQEQDEGSFTVEFVAVGRRGLRSDRRRVH